MSRLNKYPDFTEHDDVFVVATQFDISKHHVDQGARVGGAIVSETYLEKASLEAAVNRCDKLNGHYGKARIGKIRWLTDGDISELLRENRLFKEPEKKNDS